MHDSLGEDYEEIENGRYRCTRCGRDNLSRREIKMMNHSEDCPHRESMFDTDF